MNVKYLIIKLLYLYLLLMIINEDIFLYILDICINNIENQISKIDNKLNYIKKILYPLQIIKYNNFYTIKYNFVNYYIKSYLFDTIIFGKVIILYFNYFGNNIPDYISNILINPTYFTILIETNKIYKNKNKYINLNNINIYYDISKLYRYNLDNDIYYYELIIE